MTNLETSPIPNIEQVQETPRDVQFLEILKTHPEVRPIPEQLHIQPGDTFESYTNRAAGTHIEPGVYIMDPKVDEGGVGKNIVTNLAGPPLELDKVVSMDPLDTSGIKSRNGFFALSMARPDGGTVDLAFRPHEAEGPPAEDFARNVIMQHEGIPNIQTIGLYYDGNGTGGVISVLDKNLRPLNALRPDSDLFSDGLQKVAYDLAYAHTKGISHKDFATRNIVVNTASGIALAMDWGSASSRRPSQNDPEINYSISSPDLRILYDDLAQTEGGIEKFNTFFRSYSQARHEFAIELGRRSPGDKVLGEELNAFTDLLQY